MEDQGNPEPLDSTQRGFELGEKVLASWRNPPPPKPDDDIPACWKWDISDHYRKQAQQSRETDDEDLADQILEYWQDDRCAICGLWRQHLRVDHDHATGLVRGLLCSSCNTREGVWRNRTRQLFVNYRERHPTVILGIRTRYIDPRTGELA